MSLTKGKLMVPILSAGRLKYACFRRILGRTRLPHLTEAGSRDVAFCHLQAVTRPPPSRASVDFRKYAGAETRHTVRYHKACMSLLQAYAGGRLSEHLYTGSADVKLTISILCLRSDHRLVPVCSTASLF